MRGVGMKRDSDLIKGYGLKFPQSKLAQSPEKAVEFSQQIGFPVALKIVSPDILHKTDVGGVVLGLESEQSVRRAFEQIQGSVATKMPDANITGISVEEMCPGGVEVFVGLERNAQFGPTIVFGLGGIFTEILNDVVFRVLPITRGDAADMLDSIKGAKILSGFRGQDAICRDSLIDILLRVGNMGMELSDRLDSIDLNPILVWKDQHRVLDSKVLLRDEPSPLVEEVSNVAFLDHFFEAQSVAVIGASSSTGKLGNVIVDSLVRSDYSGQIYPINPHAKEIMGCAAYASLSEIPGDVDLAVVAIPLTAVPEVIEKCGEKGVHNLVIVSGGGKELGEAGRNVEADILTRARENQVRIVGPNCIGVFNGKTRLDTFFQSHERMARPVEGAIAVLTQSGTVGVALLEEAQKYGVSKFVSYGNRLDVDEADLISYLGDDQETRVIACYIEGLTDGRKFLSAARKVAHKKPIVVFKSGRTPAAAKAAMSHTGFFGGTYGPWKGAFAQAGIISVDSMEELFAVVKGLALQPSAEGNRIAMLSNGAGPMVQGIDLLKNYEISMAQLEEATLETMRKSFPPFFVIQNPVDLTGSATAADYKTAMDALLTDPNVDLLLPWFVFQDSALDESLVGILEDLAAKHGKPILCGAMGGDYTDMMSSRLEAKGIPVFHSVGDWMAAAASLCGHGY